MIITNYNNKYVKLQSDNIQDLIQNQSSYSRIDVTGTKDCTTSDSDFLVLADAGWYIDFTGAVALANPVKELFVQNIVTGLSYNIIVTPIDLGYVQAHCLSGSCTLQTYQSTFAPLFGAAISSWFLSLGIVSNVSVTFTGNVMKLTNFPNYFQPKSASSGQSSPYSEDLFSFGAVGTNLFIAPDGIYLKPDLFGVGDLQDGVYKIDLKLTKGNILALITETSCAFIDIETKCRVASKLNGLKEDAIAEDKQADTLIQTLHYALNNGSNCPCNCTDLCTIYKELSNLISDVEPLSQNCGC